MESWWSGTTHLAQEQPRTAIFEVETGKGGEKKHNRQRRAVVRRNCSAEEGFGVVTAEQSRSGTAFKCVLDVLGG